MYMQYSWLTCSMRNINKAMKRIKQIKMNSKGFNDKTKQVHVCKLSKALNSLTSCFMRSLPVL